MVEVVLGIAAASVAWFVAAGALFFNPVVDKIYRTEEEHPAVRALPTGPKTIGLILGAVLVQCVIWAFVFLLVEPALGDSLISRGLWFGAIIIAVKVVPRDIDRWLLTTYPKKRMIIELVNGALLAFSVSFSFAWLL